MSWSEALGVGGTLCAILFGYIAFSRNKKTDEKADASKEATVLVELGYIKSSVDDIKIAQKCQEDRYISTIERISAVEQSAKQAHLRLDRIEAGPHGRPAHD